MVRSRFGQLGFAHGKGDILPIMFLSPYMLDLEKFKNVNRKLNFYLSRQCIIEVEYSYFCHPSKYSNYSKGEEAKTRHGTFERLIQNGLPIMNRDKNLPIKDRQA